MERDLPYRELVDAAPDGVVVCDATGTILLVNAQGARMFGYAASELIGRPVDVLVPLSVRDHHRHHVSRYTGTPKLREMGSGLELFGTRKDGSEFPIEISLSPIKTDGGLLVTAGIRDITERKHLAAESRRAHGYLSSAIESVKDAFALFDERDRVMMVNSTARELLGRDLGSAIVGRAFGEVLRAAIAGGAFDFSTESKERLLARWLAYHQNPTGTLDVRAGTGRYLRVHERKTAERGTVLTIADVTDDVQAAEELRAARETAESASAAKSEFLSSMSHELRTPLNAILGFAQLLERDRKNPLDTRQLQRLQHVLRGGEHLLRLIDDVLDLAKIEAGGITVSLEAVELAPVVTEVLDTLGPMAERAQVTLVRPALTVGPTVVADRTRLAQILMNFGSNAIKYGKEGGRVELVIEAGPARTRVSVIDDGIGIPAAKQERIFEPFQRAGQEAGPIEGTGIGLTISKRLAELMRGGVGFASVEGQGSRFWIDIPNHQVAAADPRAQATAQAGASPLAAEASSRHLIVYVEDNPSNIAFMRDLLEELPSVELLTAPTAEIGLELIRSHLPAVAILDINLPGMSGFDALERLKAWPETQDIPVLALSAAALPRDTTRGKEAGFHRYLTKPVKVAELTAVLEELLLAR